MKKMLFIMNPYAGMRKANKHLADILTIFNRSGEFFNELLPVFHS